MTHKTRMVAVAGLLTTGLIVAAGLSDAAEANPPLAVPLAVDGCDYHCRDCGTEQNPYHDIVVAVNNEHRSSHLENCNNDGTCDDHECDDGGIGQDSLTFVSAATNSTYLIKLLKARPRLARFNSARGALQL
jgi:hypothetical protein